MTKTTFEKEAGICRDQHAKHGGCNWGRCDTCGVIPLLYKLHHGVVLEEPTAIAAAKQAVFEPNAIDASA